MTIDFILEQARDGELNQLSQKSKTDKVIVNYINLALIALYNRFQLDSEEAIITLVPGVAFYKLDGTDVNVNMPDTDVLNITYAYEENGTPIEINNTTNPYAIFTPTYNTIQVPTVGDDSTRIGVIYNRNATLVPSTSLTYDADNMLTAGLDYNIKIPQSLAEPMLHYIGYRAHGSRDGSIQAENNTHLQRFKSSCDEIEALGVISANKDIGDRDVEDKGFA